MALCGGQTRTIDQVKACIKLAKKTKADVAMARAMLRVGNVSVESRAWLKAEYPQHADIVHVLGWTDGRS
jgi:hypothetical protein